jgi:alginate O-acetyltransferase complex protein AlgI
MLFTSGQFLFVFLPIVVAVFFLTAKLTGSRLAASWLVLASVYFYGFWRPEYVALLLLSIAFNYLFGSLLQSSPAESSRRKPLLTIAIAANLIALSYYKYADFLAGTSNAVLGTHFPAFNILLPIGISFFTFTQIAYLVDSYAGKVRERNPVHYALFVTYFPHLISGPVLHHAEMMPQFGRPKTYTPDPLNFAIGTAFLAVGMTKKVLFADSAAPIANEVFTTDPALLTTATAWLGTLAYTLQIYFDFSGYSDMAVGLSLLFGVRLPYNFNSPYKARNIIDFWRRWHMTLSRFLRDYLYVPLGGNRLGIGRRYLNLIITMLLGGLWHGASWTFVVWGGLHGVYLMINHAWRHMSERARSSSVAASPALNKLGAGVSTLVTLIAVIVAWTFFRADSVSRATHLIGAMFAGRGASSQLAGHLAEFAWIAAGLGVALFFPNSQQLIDGKLTAKLVGMSSRDWADIVKGAATGAALVIITMLAFVSASRGVTEFIYFNF